MNEQTHGESQKKGGVLEERINSVDRDTKFGHMISFPSEAGWISTAFLNEFTIDILSLSVGREFHSITPLAVNMF